MSIETRLRAAMADHVADVHAPQDLAASVRRRHRRRRMRRRAVASGVVAAAAAIAVPSLLYGPGTGDEDGRWQTAPVGRSPSAGPSPGPLCSREYKAPTQEEARRTAGLPKSARTPRRHPAGVPGVDFGYMPREAKGEGWYTGVTAGDESFWGYGRLWTDTGTQRGAFVVQVMVLCSSGAPDDLLLEESHELDWGPSARNVTLRGRPARREAGHLAWLARPGVAVYVEGAENVDIDRIIAGIRLTG